MEPVRGTPYWPSAYEPEYGRRWRVLDMTIYKDQCSTLSELVSTSRTAPPVADGDAAEGSRAGDAEKFAKPGRACLSVPGQTAVRGCDDQASRVAEEWVRYSGGRAGRRGRAGNRDEFGKDGVVALPPPLPPPLPPVGRDQDDRPLRVAHREARR